MRQVLAIRRNRVYLELVVMETTMQMRAPSKQTSEMNQSGCGLCKGNALLRGKQTLYCRTYVRQVLLQSATGITKCDNFITKCDSTNVENRPSVFLSFDDILRKMNNVNIFPS